MKFSRRRWGCADDQDGVLLPGVAPARSGMNSEKGLEMEGKLKSGRGR